MKSSGGVRPDLSVVIPVYNAADTIEQIVTDFLAIPDLSVEILLVDDCSSDDSAKVITGLADAHPNVTAMHHEANLGAGIARNTAFAHAKGEYTLFFDADDIVHGSVVKDVVGGLRSSGADMAMTPYFYRRDERSTQDAMNLHDAKIWNDVTKGQTVLTVKLDDCGSLLGFSNYPWNKVLRTERYRDVGLQFGKTTVNNDILGHWYSLLFARQILLINQEMCTHIVNVGGANLTNQHSKVRMQLFDALDETYDLLEDDSRRRSRFAHHYWSLAVRTMLWARARISDDMKAEFNARFQDLLMRMDLHDYAQMRKVNAPDVADDILEHVFA